jgi:hypothetical protein
MKAGITRPDTLTRCALSSSAPPDATLARHAARRGGAAAWYGNVHGNVGEPLSGPKYRSRATTAHDGLRVAYLGGALVELAGARIALVSIRDDSMEQRKG